MGTNDDSVRVVRDANGKPVGEMRLVAVPISPEEQRAMLEGASVGSVGSPGGGESRFAGTCGTDAPGWPGTVPTLTPEDGRKWAEEYDALCYEEMAARVAAFGRLQERWLEELKAGSSRTVGVDVGSGPSVGAVSVVGPGHSYSFITPSPEIEATDDLMRRLRQKYECELLGVVPGVGLPKGVEVVREGVTAGEVRSMAVNTPRSVLRTGDLPPELAWVKDYALRVMPCPTLEEVFGPDEPWFWWVHGTDWVESNAKWEGWASRCRLESQGSAAEQEALMRRVNSMLLESGESWNGSESAAGVTPCHPFCDETPTLAALDRSLAVIGGHFPALWCGEVPMLGVWRASWVWDDWRAAVDGGSGVRETIADMVAFKFLDVPSAVWCPAPSIGAQLGSLGGPWPVTDGGWMEQSLWLTVWDRELVRGVRNARGCDLLAWMVLGAGTIPDWAMEYDKAFREWLLNPPRYAFGGYRVDRLGGGS